MSIYLILIDSVTFNIMRECESTHVMHSLNNSRILRNLGSTGPEIRVYRFFLHLFVISDIRIVLAGCFPFFSEFQEEVDR